jgi:hypothetical protein
MKKFATINKSMTDSTNIVGIIKQTATSCPAPFDTFKNVGQFRYRFNADCGLDCLSSPNDCPPGFAFIRPRNCAGCFDTSDRAYCTQVQPLICDIEYVSPDPSSSGGICSTGTFSPTDVNLKQTTDQTEWNVSCSYPLTNFDSAAAVQTYRDNFATADTTTFNENYNIIMSRFCTLPETNTSFCPSNDVSCSKCFSSQPGVISAPNSTTSTETASSLCSQWANNNPSLAASIGCPSTMSSTNQNNSMNNNGNNDGNNTTRNILIGVAIVVVLFILILLLFSSQKNNKK